MGVCLVHFFIKLLYQLLFLKMLLLSPHTQIRLLVVLVLIGISVARGSHMVPVLALFWLGSQAVNFSSLPAMHPALMLHWLSSISSSIPLASLILG